MTDSIATLDANGQTMIRVHQRASAENVAALAEMHYLRDRSNNYRNEAEHYAQEAIAHYSGHEHRAEQVFTAATVNSELQEMCNKVLRGAKKDRT